MEKTALHPKRLGEAAEVYFMYRATRLGLTLSKPLGESAPYDVICEYAGRLFRIQIKSSWIRDGSRYCLTAYYGSRRRPYTAADIDFLAAYVAPEDAWYIIPVRALRHRATVHLYPHKSGTGQLERYREAWALLLGRVSKRTRARKVQPPQAAEEFSPRREPGEAGAIR